ncbi:Alanine-tRNA ligase, eukaryota/bacteria [Gemmatirosa kalamazoonensis]|uniref:Alanine--tRNA ligase n=1 Tax=Gemmatirosa kalamazoonensis TaxID=861299 RepID=W0RIY0_9BACT|nr:alanine--tRNA ligase [Gemmatirosa kalamazoonensis]AHG91059.1 Alanine-tRNA ligase, eukaryota/bacteria [Gemmatirosa kalamazoonensis]
MRASEIRSRFLAYFQRHDHVARPSASLVPADDPTLLFTNAGMVPFKKIFLGLEDPPDGKRRATTAQKCVRAGGKHNDLEQVGHTARHHTFFEMLGNFSFGDYFKRDAIAFAWEFVTKDLGIDPKELRVSVFHEDDEARALWREIAGLPDTRIYGLGAKDNFWQMADTGPCGPCTEIYVDLAHLAKDWKFPEGATGEWTDLSRDEVSVDAFVEGAEAGRFLEIWNLVFMQFDRQPDGTLVPLPKPSVDTGAGLERIAAVLQGVTNNYHTDGFAPLIAKVEEVVGRPYTGREAVDAGEAPSYRVLADHARAVAFLLADGVFPSNEGRGYVLRRILRRAVRHAYLLGRTSQPTLYHVVQAVIDTMGDAYPELRQRAQHIVTTTRAEEERFLATIEGGLARFEELAPARTTQERNISGEDAFRLYDTFGFPIDLTELMARERDYTVDIPGFEAALERQRTQSQEERKSRHLGVAADELSDVSAWDRAPEAADVGGAFVGYDGVEIETLVTAVRHLPNGRVAVMLRETPFYAESGGQVSDRGEIVGDGWRVDVDEVRKIDGRIAAVGTLTGALQFGRVTARVPSDRRRDTERNHTATHLLHAALRHQLGEHVHQAGSVVEPDRLRFDFTHHGPVKPEQLDAIEIEVNRGVWAAVPLSIAQKPYQEAVAGGAMALFGEKYGDVVRVVDIPGLSTELCGGTHVRNTAEIGLFRIVSETGVAAGVRRITALTGPKAYELLRERERELAHVAELVKAPLDQAPRRVAALVEERRQLERRLEEAMKGGGASQVQALVSGAQTMGNARLVTAEVSVADVKALQALGDALREVLADGVAVLGARLDDGKATVLAVVGDGLRDRGVRADDVVRRVAAAAGGRGGGKPHMAQAGIPDAGRLGDALREAPELVRPLLEAA